MRDSQPVPEAVQASYAAFIRALERGERLRRGRILRAELIRAGAALAIAAALILWLNAAIASVAPIAGPLLVMVAAAAIVVMGRAVARARAPIAPREAALALEARDGELGRSALLAIDLWSLREDGRENYSLELVIEAVRRRTEAISGRDFGAPFTEPFPARWSAAGLLGVTLAVLALALSPAATARLLGARVGAPALEVTPGDARVLAGDSLTVRVAKRGGDPDAEVWVELADGNRYPMTPATATAGASPAATGPGDYAYTFRRVLRGFEYRARSAKAESPRYSVTITERPRVSDVALVVHPPAYTGAAPQVVKGGDGHVAALRGSRIEFTARATVPLAKAAMVVEAADSTAAKAGGATTIPLHLSDDGLAATGDLRVDRSAGYRFALTAKEGWENLPEDPRAIVAIDDEAPIIRFLRPEAQVTLGADPSLPLAVSAVDDYGLGPVVLHYRVSHGDNDSEAAGNERAVPLGRGAGTRSAAGREIDIDFPWDLQDLDLGPGDVVNYWATVTDNDAVRGPKESRTAVYQARFPGVEEIFAQVTGDDAEQRSSLEDVAREQKELQEKTEELSRQSARSQDLSWEQRQAAADMLDKQRELQSKLGDVVKALEENAKTAQEQNLLSQQILDRMAELQELMRQVATPEMLKAMQEMQQRLAQISPQELAQAMKQLSMNQDELLKRLERSIALLKRFEMEQRLEAMVARADELLDRQDKLLQNLDDASSKLGELATREERVSADTEKLQKDAQKLAQDLAREESKASEALEQASASVDSEQVKEELNQASREMTGGNRSGGKSHGSRGRGGQKNFRDRLALAQNQFNESLRNEIATEMKRASKEVLALSLDEETLAGRMDGGGPGDQGESRSLAAEQQDLLGGLRHVADRLMKLGEKTMFMNPRIGQNLGNSLNQMSRAVDELSDGRSRPAGDNARGAIVAMNQTVIELRKAQDEASSCQSPSGMQQMMQMLGTASCNQAGLNQDTQNLSDQISQQGQDGQGLTDRERAEMSRLAAEQRAISDMVRQAIDQQNGPGPDGTLGRLDRTLDEMKQTMEDLHEGRLTGETRQRQDRILSRLLDAQRSARRRDFEERRTSRPGEIHGTLVSPAPLPDALTHTPAAMREDLLRAANERYPAEYEALIREYFRSLWNQEPR